MATAKLDLSDAKSIVGHCDVLADHWKPRNDKMIAHQDLYELKATVDSREGHVLITSNRPCNIVNFATSIIAATPPKHRIPYEYGPKDTELQRARSGTLERFLIAIWRAVDQQQLRKRRAAMHWELTYYACLRGWLAAVAVWTGDDEFPYHIRTWDPLHVYPDADDPDLVFIRYRRSLSSIAAEYPKSKIRADTKDTDFIEMWSKTKHGIIAAGDWIKRPMPHGLKHCPVIVLPVGGYPVRSVVTKHHSPSRTSALGENAYVGHMGQSMLYAIEDIQRMENQTSSDVADVFHQYSHPITVTNTLDGKPIDVTIDPDDSVAMQTGESIHWERPPGFQQDQAAWLNRLSLMIEQATFPSVMYGSPGPTSGFDRNLINNAGMMRLIASVHAIENTYTELDRLILQQLEDNAAPLLFPMKGTDYYGQVFKEMVDLYDIRQLVGGDHDVEVEIKPSLPQDRQQAVAMAGALKQQMIWSRPTINEQLFPDDIQDAQGEEQRLTDQLIKDNPAAVGLMAEAFAPIAVLRNARMMLDSGRITQEEYDLVRMSVQNQLTIKTGQERKAMQELAMPGMERGPGGIPVNAQDLGQGQIPGPPGIPPEILAAQMQGAPSPGEGRLRNANPVAPVGQGGLPLI